jgi:hypothetical protein
MDTKSILAAIDAEIGRLQGAHSLLSKMDKTQVLKDTTTPAKKSLKRRTRLSSAAGRRIAEAQKKRWAAVNATKTAPIEKATVKSAPKRKTRMTPEAKKRIAEAQRKRWATVRAAKSAAAKKAPAKKGRC